jgi:hypothetical protein
MLVPRRFTGMRTMNKELKAVVGHVLQSNLAVLGAFIAISPSLPEEQQHKLLESLDTMKTASQALLELLNTSK